MKLSLKFHLLVAVACAAVCAGPVFAQRASNTSASAKPAPGSYDIANDVSLQGTVLSYTENSATPPIGAHVLLQTASGNVDVHLGDARLLHLANLQIVLGSTVRFIGQSNQTGTNSMFLARLVQVRTQVLAVRSERGFLLGPAGVHAAANKALFANATPNKKGVAR